MLLGSLFRPWFEVPARDAAPAARLSAWEAFAWADALLAGSAVAVAAVVLLVIAGRTSVETRRLTCTILGLLAIALVFVRGLVPGDLFAVPEIAASEGGDPGEGLATIWFALGAGLAMLGGGYGTVGAGPVSADA
jgi:hypothetical protein